MKITLSTSAKLTAGRAEILLRISISRTQVYRVKSHIFIQPDRFQEGRIIVPRTRIPEYSEIVQANNNLSNLVAYLTSALMDPQTSASSSADVQLIIDRYHNPVPDVSEWWQIWTEWVSQTKVSTGRMKRYNVVRRDMERYEDYRHRPLSLSITSAELLDIETFLRNEHRWNKEVQQRGDAVIKSLMSVLRTFVNYCIKIGMISNDPFRDYHMPKEVYGVPFYLTLEERDRIAEYDYGSESLNRQRDVFVFQCLVGCRVGDLLRLTRANVVDGVLEYTPQKTKGSTGTAVRVPLNDRAQKIVDSYDLADGRLLPFISSQRYNDTIKILCMRADVDRMVTVLNPINKVEERRPIYEVASSHMARRTFIGNLYRQVQDPNLIGSMSGHAEGSKAFARYRQIDEDVKRKIVDLIK